MSNKIRRRVSGYFLLTFILAVLSGTMMGCTNSGAPADLGNATPKPPPTNVDPVTGKPRGAGAPPAGAPGPR